MSTQQVFKKPLQCKWCQAEITFSNSRLSPNGKKIPLSAVSLEPHRCSKNPYYQNPQSSTVVSVEAIKTEQQQIDLKVLNAKLDTITEYLKKLADLYNEKIEGLNS